jgi:lipoyl(octanoyl) transferase
MANSAVLQIIQFKQSLHYKTAWELQKNLQQLLIQQKLSPLNDKPITKSDSNEHYLVLCQHPPVYTLGKNAKHEHLLLTPYELEQRQIDSYHIERGGDITFHGPGQLVLYPIFDLESLATDLHSYLRTLEQIIIDCLAQFKIPAGRIDKLTGVWVGIDTPNPRKIAAIGLKVSRWVTMHGLALNINTDLAYFDHIIPCGIADKGVTSLGVELNQAIDFESVQQELVSILIRAFQFTNVRYLSPEAALSLFSIPNHP